MKKLYSFAIIALLAVTVLNAQVRISTDATPAAASSMLDVNSANKGMLIPRVALTGTTDVTTIPSPATSLLVYNTATTVVAGTIVTPGFYYWNGTSWVQLATTNSIVNVPDIVDMKGVYNAATTYSQDDLVATGTNRDVFFYSLKAGNTGNTPGSAAAWWQPVEVEQLKQIHKTMPLPSPSLVALVSMLPTGTNAAGGRIQYLIRATGSGGQLVTDQGVIQYSATHSTITCTLEPTESLSLGTLNTGCSPGFFSPSSQPGLSISDNLAFTPAVLHDVYFRIFPMGGQLVGASYAKLQLRIEP